MTMRHITDGLWTDDDGHFWDYGPPRQVEGMHFPVQCTKCSRVYDLGKVEVIGRYTDCSVWKCPGCKCTVDDRPAGWGDHHYTELDERGFPKQDRR